MAPPRLNYITIEVEREGAKVTLLAAPVNGQPPIALTMDRTYAASVAAMIYSASIAEPNTNPTYRATVRGDLGDLCDE